MDYADLIPINVLTGFLGSGKTSVLSRLLASPDLSGAAVLINEVGEVGLDHHLLEDVSESAVLLENGCVCCAVRGDLRDALRSLQDRRQRGDIPAYDRVMIETSGLADPVPIAYTILTDAVLQHHFRLGQIVATADAVNVQAQLAHHPETSKQLAVADRVVLTKSDLTSGDGLQSAVGAIRAINTAAPIIDAADPLPDLAQLLLDDTEAGALGGSEFEGWLSDGAAHRHSEGVRTLTLRYPHAVDWTAFGVWLSLLLQRHGDRVLRVKGLLEVDDLPGPVLVNGVQHIVHPPKHLDAWPSGLRGSCVVIIASGLETTALERSLERFMALAPSAERVTPVASSAAL